MKTVIFEKREFLIISFCIFLFGAILGNLWGSTAVRTTIKETKVNQVPVMQLEIAELRKDQDEMYKMVFGKAKQLNEKGEKNDY